MGIPRLYSHLRPHAHPQTLPPGTTLSIDGPGLAYHVYDQCISASTLRPSDNPWDAAIPYAVFQVAVLKYLDTLRACGLHIAHIYFDGALPSSKRPTRLTRLTGSLSKLQAYRSAHNTLRPTAHQPQQELDVFSATEVSIQRLTPLPVPPFIVAAAIYALQRTIYNHVTFTVPGEADGYCAREAINSGGVVLTSDSDLLLYEGGGYWGVIMFRDLVIDYGSKKANGRLFYPTSMARELGIDLRFMGFLVLEDPQAELAALQQRCLRIEQRQKTGSSAGKGRPWQEFSAGYTLPTAPGGCTLEPRIAEIVAQLEQDAKAQKEMFLPFLWEDPTRGSAWDTAQWVRALAYSVLFAGTTTTSVEEMCRVGQRITGRLVALVSDPLLRIQSITASTTPFTTLILTEITTILAPTAEPLPEQSVSHSPTSSSYNNYLSTKRWTWNRAHILAMAQAAWYSFLLLKEVLALRQYDIGCLAALPAVSCLDIRGQVTEEVLEGYSAWAAKTGVGAKPKEKKKETQRGGGLPRGVLAGNMFAALAE